ncbi:MAG TPA: hypothetical protein VLT45_19790 [Kofleriaceae bacterium]|nr:hypothetical protein [Kofleriaceae bacterium]
MAELIDMRARVRQLREMMQTLDAQLKQQRQMIDRLARVAGATR